MAHFTLTNGLKIPALAFGAGSKWRIKKVENDETADTIDEGLVNTIQTAIKAGFRHIDAAEAYQTHREIAQGIKKSGVERSEICITSKYLPGWRGKHAMSPNPYTAIQKALKELETDYIDVFMIHNPFFNLEWTKGVTVEQAWADLERAYNEGLVKSIGVSNFPIEYYQRVLDSGSIKPMVLQVEMHPYCYNQTPGIVGFAKKHGAQLEAYGTLTPIFRAADGPLTPVLEEMSARYNKTPSQIILRWIYQNGVVPLTTTSNAARIHQALEIFDESFELSPEDFQRITDVGSTFPYREYFNLEWGTYAG